MKSFPHWVAESIEIVMEDPDKYIIPENRAAIEYLWDMNIITTQTNDYENKDSWIAIGKLSDENEEIFTKLRNDIKYDDETKPGILMQYGSGFRVPVKPGTRDTFLDFLPLFDLFHYQDVQRDGYMTVEEFYTNYTDCFKLIDNPYIELIPKPKDYDDFDLFRKALREYDSHNYSVSPLIKVFDETKTTKSLEEYLEDAGLLDYYDKEEGKIFKCKRLYDGHMKYKENQNEHSKTK